MSRPPTLLALRALGLGDVLVCVPALRALSRAFPGHRRLLAGPGWLDPVVAMIGGWSPVHQPGPDSGPPPGLGPIEVAVNLHGNGAASAALLDSLRPAVRIGHRGHGWRGPSWRPELPERRRWCRLLEAHGIPADDTDLRLDPPPAHPPPARPAGPADPRPVLVHPGAAYGAKRWPPGRFSRVATVLRGAGHRVLVTGSPAETALCGEVAIRAGLPPAAVLAGRTTLGELAGLVASARLVISGDTGIAHLATAFCTPSVTLFGPVDAARWGPPGGPHRALQVPDRRRGDPFAADPDPALVAIGVPDVLAAVTDLGVLR